MIRGTRVVYREVGETSGICYNKGTNNVNKMNKDQQQAMVMMMDIPVCMK